MRTKQKRTGVTISEMCVVLAIVAIVALSVVSFTTMVSAHTRASAARLNAMQDLDLTQKQVGNWLDQMAENKIPVQISADGKTLSAQVGEEAYTVSVADEMLEVRYLTQETIQLSLKSEIDLQFSSMTNATGTIYFCTMAYELPVLDERTVEQSYTFCIAPRVGEVIG